jgi:hypothetical protein
MMKHGSIVLVYTMMVIVIGDCRQWQRYIQAAILNSTFRYGYRLM